MTEPRVPETDVGEGESTQPIQARPEPASWYPVEAARPEPEAAPAPEPVGDPAPAEDRPVADEEPSEPDPRAEEEPTRVLAGDSEPTVVTAEPEPAPVADETEVAPEPEPSDSEPTAVVAEPTAVVAEPEPTAVVNEPEPTAVVREPEPTVVVEAPAEPAHPVTEAPGDAESTAVLHREVAAGPVPFAVGPTESIFRPPSPTTGSSPEPEPTRMEQLSDEEQKLAAERAARRDARAAALAAPAPQPQVAPEPVVVHKRTNDKFLGSLGLFLLRLVLAGIFAIRGLNLLTDIPAAQAMFAKTIIPEPGIMAIVTGAAALLIALSLVLGLLTRLAGLGIALIAGGALAFVYWGNWSPFVAGRPGFLGEFELLLAVVGVLLICIGGGGWSLDRSFRSGRERDKADRAATEG